MDIIRENNTDRIKPERVDFTKIVYNTTVTKDAPNTPQQKKEDEYPVTVTILNILMVIGVILMVIYN